MNIISKFKRLIVSLAFASVLSFIVTPQVLSAEKSDQDHDQQSEISIHVTREEGERLIRSAPFSLLKRRDMYFDFAAQDGALAITGQSLPYKLRLMARDNGGVKLQASKILSTDTYPCGDANLMVKTKDVYENNGNHQMDLQDLAKDHQWMISSLVDQRPGEFLELEKRLGRAYDKLDYFLKDEVDQATASNPNFVALYSSQKEKYRREIQLVNGKSIELSVTFATDAVGSIQPHEAVIVEFENHSATSDSSFASNACELIRGLGISGIPVAASESEVPDAAATSQGLHSQMAKAITRLP